MLGTRSELPLYVNEYVIFEWELGYGCTVDSGPVDSLSMRASRKQRLRETFEAGVKTRKVDWASQMPA